MLKRKDYIYNWDEIPIIVDAYFVADLLKCSVDIIYKDCRKGKEKDKAVKEATAELENKIEGYKKKLEAQQENVSERYGIC